MFILGSLESASWTSYNNRKSTTLIERFSLGVTAEALRAKIDRKSARSV